MDNGLKNIVMVYRLWSKIIYNFTFLYGNQEHESKPIIQPFDFKLQESTCFEREFASMNIVLELDDVTVQGLRK